MKFVPILFYIFTVIFVCSSDSYSFSPASSSPKDSKKSEVFILKSSVNCPFAKRSSIWKNSFAWNILEGIDANVKAFIEKDLKPFVQNSLGDEPAFDSIALQVPGDFYAMDLETFTEFFRRVMIFLDREGVEKLQNLQMDEEGYYWDDGWQFSFMGERLFIITLAPFYSDSSSRFCYSQNSATILFQTEASFKHYLSKNRRTRQKEKESVRKAFTKKGQCYFPSTTIEPNFSRKTHEAPRYIKPLNPSDDPIKWWIPNKSIRIHDPCSLRSDKDFDVGVGCMLQ